MKSRTGSLLLGLVALLALAAAMLLFSSPAAAALPEDTCTLAGTVRTCHLWATTGTVTMPDGLSVPIWGFAGTAGISATLPGPTLIGHQGETMHIVLHNTLPMTLALEFPGQDNMVQDLAGIPSGSELTYTFPLTAGTFLYEAGLTADGARQVAMGLYGALIVRSPVAGQAYDDPSSAYTKEELLVLSEIDPALNNDPFGMPLIEYAPRYFLINGVAYPETAEIPVDAGDTLLLRIVNAGLRSHPMGMLGHHQTMIANDGKLKLPLHRSLVEMVAAGQTMDTLVNIPVTALQGERTLLYDTNLLLHNASAALPDGSLAYGGMMTFIHVLTGAVPGAAGPIVSNVQIAPNPTTGAAGVTISATVTSAVGVTSVEYFTQSVGLPGTGAVMAASGIADVYTANVDAAVMANWSSGFVTFYVRGLDANGWGPVGSGVLNLDKLGPESIGLSLWPEPSNGTRPVLLRATGDDHTNGNNPVVAGQYSVNGAPALPMTLARLDSPITAMTATLPLETVQLLAEGLHPISVTSQDSLLNWGAPGIITLTMDLTGPDATGLSLTPSTLDLSGAPPVTSVRLQGTVTDPVLADAQSKLKNAEGFVEVVGPNGTGFDLFPSDGMFDEVSEGVYLDISVGAFLLLSQGQHPVWVHGLDAAGNWGPMSQVLITIDRGVTTDTTGPIITAPVAVPNPTSGAITVTVTAQAADEDLLSNIAGAEWYVDAGFTGMFLPADGAFDEAVEGLTTVIDVSGWPNGAHILNLVARDVFANPGPTAQLWLAVEGNNAVLVAADNFEAGTLAAWISAVGDVTVVPEAGLGTARAGLGLRAGIDGGAPAYVIDAMPVGETTYRAHFLYDPNSANMGSTAHSILAGLYGDKAIFGIQIQASSTGGYELRGWAMSDGIPMYTGWHSIGDEPHSLGMEWQAASQATFSLLVDGLEVGTLDWLDTAAYEVYQVWLGASGDIDPAATGAEYFDEFEARRNPKLFLPTILRGQ